MAERAEYNESINLIKEAESLIKESFSLLNDIKNNINNKDREAEIEALREAVVNLKLRNDCLYMENVLLKSKIKELTIKIQSNIEKSSMNSIKDYLRPAGKTSE